MQVQLPAGQVAGQPGAQPQTYILVPQQPPQQQPQKVEPKCNKKAMIIVGSLQILMGILAIAFNAAGIGVKAALAVASHGIWGGVMFILAGSFQVVAATNNNKCPTVASMVLAIIAAVFCVPTLILSAIGIPLDQDNERYARQNRDWYYENSHNTGNYWHGPSWDYLDDFDERYAMNGLLVGIAIVEGLLALVSSISGCKSLCCRQQTAPSVPHQVQYMVNPAQPGQQIMVLTPMPNNQALYPNQYQQPQPATILPVNPTVQPTQQVITVAPMGQVQGQVGGQVSMMQPGFTAPVLTTAGAPPAYSYVPASQAAPVHGTQSRQPPEEETKSRIN